MQPGSRGPSPAAVPGHLPDIPRRSAALRDSEIARMAFRVQLLMRRGFPEYHAERWADVLVSRDRARDDRRLCAECAHLSSAWACRQGQAVVTDRLQRCQAFDWSKP